MKYFKLTTIGVNRKEIGISPQSTDGNFGDIQKDFIPFEGKIDFDFELPIPKLQKKSKSDNCFRCGYDSKLVFSCKEVFY